MKKIVSMLILLAVLGALVPLWTKPITLTEQQHRLLPTLQAHRFVPKPPTNPVQRDIMMTEYLSQWAGSGNTWIDDYRATIQYNSAYQIHIITSKYWDSFGSVWMYDARQEISYRPDGNPANVVVYTYDGVEWNESGGMQFTYNGAQIQFVDFFIIEDGESYDMINYAFYYHETTQLLDHIIMDFSLFFSNKQRFSQKVHFSLDNLGRPEIVTAYSLDDDEEWVMLDRTIVQYHPQDISDAETYVRYLLLMMAYGDFEIIPDGTVLIVDEEKSYSYTGEDWYHYGLVQYSYNPTMTLHQTQYYAQYDRIWQLQFQEDFAYNDDDLMIEWVSSYATAAVVEPEQRRLYSYSDVSMVEDNIHPPQISSLKAYPNPFNPKTNIAFELERAENVRLDVYNLKGQKVRTLLNENMIKGAYQVEWDGKDDNGLGIGSGMYILILKSAGNSRSTKVILLK